MDQKCGLGGASSQTGGYQYSDSLLTANNEQYGGWDEI
jgi:hypothetical protein